MEPNRGAMPFTFLPGQYASITSEIEGQKVRRSYTISSSPTQRDYIELTIKREQYGLESRHLHDHAATGDLLEIAAPAGRFFFTGKEAEGVPDFGPEGLLTPEEVWAIVTYERNLSNDSTVKTPLAGTIESPTFMPSGARM